MVTDQDYWDEQQKLIESQAAEIASLNADVEHYKSGLTTAIETIKSLEKLCDQLGSALDGHCAPFLGHEEEHRLALEAWRESKWQQ